MSNLKRLFLAMAVVAAVIAALWFTNRAVTPKKATWSQIQAEAATGGYRLITTEGLSRLYRENPDMLLVDTRQEWEYRTGHIQGAVNFPMEPTWWSRWSKKEALAKFLGPDKDKLLVFYWAGLAWVRSDSAARVAVQLGYTKVYRDPLGYPQWKAKGLPVAKSPVAANLSSQGPRPPGRLFGWAMVGTLLAVFLGGLALNLTPCVYPLIPITVSYFGGRSGQSRGGGVLAHALFYLGGLVLINSVLGVTAALTGGLMGAALQSPVVLVLVAAVLTAFALSMFGLWEIRLPSFLTNAAVKSHSGYFGSLFMGLTLGVVAAPCIGPFILGLLTWVASLGSPWLGFIIFFTLSLGLGLPLFVLALFSGKLDRLPRSGEWMVWVRKLMGWVLLGMAAYFLGPLLPHGGRYPLLALVALCGAVHLGWLERSQAAFKGFSWLRTVAALAGLVLATYLAGTWLMMGPGVSWKPYSDNLLATARQQGKPVIIDFYADWCAPCRELGDITLHDKRVVQLADQRFVMIKVDLTTKDPELHPPLLAKYKVLGVPTVVFIDARGQPRPELRLVDFLPPEKFLARMKQVLEPLAADKRPTQGKGE